MKIHILLPLYAPRTGWEVGIIEAVQQLKKVIDPSMELYLYITNDGASGAYYSNDALRKVAETVNGNFSFLKYENNRGKGYSLRHMVKYADGDYIIYTDGDFPFGWEAVVETLKALEDGADVVMGRRSSSYNAVLSPFRKCLSSGVKILNQWLCGLPEVIQDTQAGLKGFNHKGRETFLQTTVDTFVFDTEFILLAWSKGLKITPIDVKLRSDLKLSAMGMKVLFRELLCFVGILWRVRIKKSYR